MNRLRTELVDLLRLATPVVGTRLGIMAMGLTDTVVVGRHSTTELGYVALGWAPTAVVMTTGVGLLSGLQVLTARRIGEGRRQETGAVLRRGGVYAFWLGVIATLGLAALGPAFLRATGIEPGLAEGAGRVLVIFALSMVPALVATACSTFLEALGRAAPAMWAMWGANALNLALQLALVPSLGALGAAWGTLGARVALMVLLIAWIARMGDARDLGLFSRPTGDRAAAAEQRRIGYAAGIAFFAETAAFSSMNIVAGWVGGLAVAGWAIVLNVAAIIFMVPLGLGAAASVLVARAHGADDRRGVARAGAVAFAVTLAFTAVVTAGVWWGASFIAGLYTPDPALLGLVAGALTLACLFFIADGLQVVAAHALRARGDVLVSTLVQIVSYAVVMLPLGWALALPAGLGLDGIVLAVTAASFIAAGLLLGRFWVLAKR
jgi:MATE family multidrug resistance protein